MKPFTLLLLVLFGCSQNRKTDNPSHESMKLSLPFTAYTVYPVMSKSFLCHVEVVQMSDTGVAIIQLYAPELDSIDRNNKRKDGLTTYWKGEVDMTVTDSKGFSTTRDEFIYRDTNYVFYQMTPGSSIASVTIKTHER